LYIVWQPALESLEKSLKLGFGSYFQLMNDADLDFIRQLPEFKALLRQYFLHSSGY